MSHSQEPPVPPHPRPPAPLYKQKSWSPDLYRDEAWLKRQGINKNRHRRSKSVTNEDIDELKGCIELGFGFADSPEIDRRLSDTLPALGLLNYALNKQYYNSATSSFTSSASDGDVASPLGSPGSIFYPGDTPQTVKTRLKQWAQVVACSVRQSSSSN
ncbi:Membrane insertase YidC [Heracleum sosnowskyi]|uniref:Membrane insertase YidC n=1 Tax=Heracleum sosnowskyi TaxID=360622 RepID=A0AAD8MS01_9APIA|nr:Membrane insertase YidC [Heracleum sosnowskyi]